MRQFKKIFVFFHLFIFYLDRSPITMKSFLKNLCIFKKKISTFFTNQVSRLEQLDYLQKIFAILLHRVGCLEQLDHFLKKIKRNEEEGLSRLFSLQIYYRKPKENEFFNVFAP